MAASSRPSSASVGSPSLWAANQSDRREGQDRAMDQGLKDALSPNEETTLRRVDYGIAKPTDFHTGDIEYLTRLTLIERNGDKLIVTSLGKQRLAAMRG